MIPTSSFARDRLADADALSLWNAWKLRGDRPARDRLILSYAPMVKYLAYKRVRELPPHVDVDDLISAGLLLLTQAVDGFSPDKGATFEQYAWTRVAGGITDELRRSDFAPRALRRQLRTVEQARDALTAQLGREPSKAELAAKTGMSAEEFAKMLRRAAKADVCSLQTTLAIDSDGSGQPVELIETLVDSSIPSNEERLITSERHQVIRAVLEQMDEREQLVAQMVFIDGRSGRDVAVELGLSQSRVSQLLSQIRVLVKDALWRYDDAASLAVAG